tara:strand:- start:315 stop:1874 length:1560 start_codon:yes stop_codon:yes gene_type:complete
MTKKSKTLDITKTLTIRLHENDDVVIARNTLDKGSLLSENMSDSFHTIEQIPPGHKVAIRCISEGEPIKKFNQIIGFAEKNIKPGEHVHNHNMSFGNFEREYKIKENSKPSIVLPESARATFSGIIRQDGRIATRNYLAVLTSVNCSATVARYIADHFRFNTLNSYHNVDGVIALSHHSGCGMGKTSDGFSYLRRTLAGYANHPNIAGFLLLGLGCEVNQVSELFTELDIAESKMSRFMTIQDSGGTTSTVKQGITVISEMLEEANLIKRDCVAASNLILGLECGGSDGFSGITANPSLGRAVDILVSNGGTAILGETPEIYGAEHLLASRAISENIANKLMDRIRWWEKHAKANGVELDNNPTPGNRKGGITTILEKSLGAAAKGGTTDLVEVYRYGEQVNSKGFVFMDTPGYDPVSITGMVAGGANIVCFTTGRGSVFGCKPTPSLKLSTTTNLYESMKDDIDINCGSIADGIVDVDTMGQKIFEKILDTASGTPTKSELLGMGEEEFVPWQVGAVL